MDGVSKNRGKPPKIKMDGENKGKPYFLMDDLGGRPTPIFGSTPSFFSTRPWHSLAS